MVNVLKLKSESRVFFDCEDVPAWMLADEIVNELAKLGVKVKIDLSQCNTVEYDGSYPEGTLMTISVGNSFSPEPEVPVKQPSVPIEALPLAGKPRKARRKYKMSGWGRRHIRLAMKRKWASLTKAQRTAWLLKLKLSRRKVKP